MQVFITGASGHIGSALIPELLGAGHEVIGLARSDAAAEAVEKRGAKVQRGSLDDLDVLRDAGRASDGVIHLAFMHEQMNTGDLEGALAADIEAIEAIGDALAGTGKPFVGTSGTLMLAFSGVTGVGTETDVATGGLRGDAENAVVALAQRNVRSSVVRLPPTVHSSLDHHGFVPALIGFARERGHAGYAADGSNRWPAVHTLDAAHLYRLALEGAPAGSRLHAVGDEGVQFRKIAESIGRNLDLPVTGIAPDDLADYFSYLAFFVSLDNPTSSTLTQGLLDWHPARPGLLDDLDEGHYFAV